MDLPFNVRLAKRELIALAKHGIQQFNRDLTVVFLEPHGDNAILVKVWNPDAKGWHYFEIKVTEKL